MTTESSLAEVLSSKEPPTPEELLQLILPVQAHQHYSLADIDHSLDEFYQVVESLQRTNNDEFDKQLDEPVQTRLAKLSQVLQATQLDLMKLHCEVAHAKDQFGIVKKACNSEVIQQRQQLDSEIARLQVSLHQSKFRDVKRFFDLFLIHLDASVGSLQRLMSNYASRYIQTFDWAHYHQIMFLLRACGKSLMDIDRFERLYQGNNTCFLGLEFKTPIEKIDLNNYVEFHSTYSLDSQLLVILPDGRQTRREFGGFMTDLACHRPEMFVVTVPMKYDLFSYHFERLSTVTNGCCRLLVDLNLNYIEAHFTEGINIDRLNGCDSTSSGPPSEELPLPEYAISPQEYITQIGQHVLTLRKQTEQFDQCDSSPTKIALQPLEANENFTPIRRFQTVTGMILTCIAGHCIRSLVGRTSTSIMSKLTTNGRRQLATDARYLNSVLEDLGVLNERDPNVEKFRRLFRGK